MKVQDIMTPEVQSCGLDTNLSTAAKMMWDSDCGTLPVVSREGKVLGMVTDRDICMSVATKNKAPWARPCPARPSSHAVRATTSTRRWI